MRCNTMVATPFVGVVVEGHLRYGAQSRLPRGAKAGIPANDDIGSRADRPAAINIASAIGLSHGNFSRLRIPQGFKAAHDPVDDRIAIFSFDDPVPFPAREIQIDAIEAYRIG